VSAAFLLATQGEGAAALEASTAIGSPELALVGALLALSGLALAPFVVFVVTRLHAGRCVFFARWGFTHLAQVVLVFLVVSALAPRVWPLPKEASLELLLARGALAFAAAGALVFHFARKLSPEGARELGLRAERNASAVAAGFASYVLLAPALFGLGLLWPWVLERLGGTWTPQAVLPAFQELAGARLALAIGLAVVVMPFLEELLFRGFLQPLLVQNFRDKGGILLTSLAFAALHGLGAFLPIFALSLLLGGIMLRTQRLVACWAVHALHNGLTLALLLASEEVRAALPRSAASLSFLFTSS
jgi:membrane protease YdiL (CAAX protease family)